MKTQVQAVPSRRRFDVDEYHVMVRAGILIEGDRVELIEGEIVEMHAIGSRHLACVIRLNRLLVQGLAELAAVSIQSSVRLDRYSEPEPDVVVLRPRSDDYAAALPGPPDALLVIEVADTSLAYDRTVKLRLYAEAGVPEVWIVDLAAAAVEVHRQPSGEGYRHIERITEGRLAPAAFPDLELELIEILPPALESAADDQGRARPCPRR
ncbi:MAG TPA: Uma2 family endonuclease [Acidobacteriota bacterium]